MLYAAVFASDFDNSIGVMHGYGTMLDAWKNGVEFLAKFDHPYTHMIVLPAHETDELSVENLRTRTLKRGSTEPLREGQRSQRF